jgi:catechol 2,3-dioxygenase-like lactoylglutathione lyase family enzyme
MEFKNPLLVVKDLQTSLKFYQEVLGLEIVLNFGANVTLTGGISLQTEESWLEFLEMPESALRFGGNDAELYFETDDFDGFVQTVEQRGVPVAHPPLEHRWGQRVVRIYDPDRHILEVAEPMTAVCRRFREGGLSVEGVARRMNVPVEYVKKCLQANKSDWLP